MSELVVKPLTREGFAPYGEVVGFGGGDGGMGGREVEINGGLTMRFDDLFKVDVEGRAVVSVFETKPLVLPHRVRVMERHPLGSQAFLPLDAGRFLVLVGREGAGGVIGAGDLELFLAGVGEGVNIFRNTWHHFQMVLGEEGVGRRFLVVDGGGEGNLEEKEVAGEVWVPGVDFGSF